MLEILIDYIFVQFWWVSVQTNDWYSNGHKWCSAGRWFFSTRLWV